ncbi:hypothetical protein FEM48_ZijujMtG0003300 (mitochondrion) [Ziziphus jujuba var. spinosa]|uniref:Uncharacterized protein n=1 Tax=Ziziphus jujuba var. spinosa TaxID=714518 RepID=A0A978UA78_ZIZJJ|nr:hypothetical protein FEM48_ZijujMtG0003300 [Ziziphus jujuba var. spinosa]
MGVTGLITLFPIVLDKLLSSLQAEEDKWEKEAFLAVRQLFPRRQSQSLAETSSPPISALLPVDGYYASSCSFDFFDSSSSSNEPRLLFRVVFFLVLCSLQTPDSFIHSLGFSLVRLLISSSVVVDSLLPQHSSIGGVGKGHSITGKDVDATHYASSEFKVEGLPDSPVFPPDSSGDSPSISLSIPSPHSNLGAYYHDSRGFFLSLFQFSSRALSHELLQERRQIRPKTLETVTRQLDREVAYLSRKKFGYKLHPVSVLLPTTDGRRLGRIARLNKREATCSVHALLSRTQDLRQVSSPFGNTFLLVGAKPDANIPGYLWSILRRVDSTLMLWLVSRLVTRGIRIGGKQAAAALGHPIPLLSFAADLTSHREQLLLVQGHQMRDLPPIPRNRSSGGLPSTHLSIYKTPPQRRAEAPG